MSAPAIKALFMSLPVQHHDALLSLSPKTRYWVPSFTIESGGDGFTVSPATDGVVLRAIHHFGHSGPYYTVNLLTFQQSIRGRVLALVAALRQSPLLPEGAVLEII